MLSSNLRDGMRFLALVALLCAIGHRTSVASGIIASIEYSSTGTIGADRIDGPSVVGFQGVVDATAETGSIFSLGRFTVAVLADGQVTNYDNTPFEVSYFPGSIAGIREIEADAPLTIKGWITGTISARTSNLKVVLNPYIQEYDGKDQINLSYAPQFL